MYVKQMESNSIQNDCSSEVLPMLQIPYHTNIGSIFIRLQDHRTLFVYEKTENNKKKFADAGKGLCVG